MVSTKRILFRNQPRWLLGVRSTVNSLSASPASMQVNAAIVLLGLRPVTCRSVSRFTLSARNFHFCMLWMGKCLGFRRRSLLSCIVTKLRCRLPEAWRSRSLKDSHPPNGDDQLHPGRLGTSLSDADPGPAQDSDVCRSADRAKCAGQDHHFALPVRSYQTDRIPLMA